MSLSSYPAGAGRMQRVTPSFRCPDDDCDQQPWQATGTAELGRTFLDDEEDGFCPSCEREAVED